MSSNKSKDEKRAQWKKRHEDGADNKASAADWEAQIGSAPQPQASQIDKFLVDREKRLEKPKLQTRKTVASSGGDPAKNFRRAFGEAKVSATFVANNLTCFGEGSSGPETLDRSSGRISGTSGRVHWNQAK